MPRLLLALTCSFFVLGCYENHSAPRRYPDGAVIPEPDAWTRTGSPTDAAIRRDAWAAPVPDMGTLPQQDAGVHAIADAGPPGDRAGGEWNGYVEAYTFPSGSDHVRIVLDSAPSGGVSTSGYVIFGAGLPPDPPTDPNVGWPPGTSDLHHQVDFGTLFEGYAYRFVDAPITADRVHITLDLGSPWETWCELQYPVLLTRGSTDYNCMPNTSGYWGTDGCSYADPTTGAEIAVDCGRARLCAVGGGACGCDASACTARPSEPVVIDFHVTGNDGGGTILGHNAYLTR